MKKFSLVLFTKGLLDFMFFSGIIICISVPFLFKHAGRYINIFDLYYVPLSIIYIISGIFALAILSELRKMFKTVINENPFIRENVTSLKKMGIYAFVIAVLMGVKLIFTVTFAALVLILVFIIAGLFSLVLAQVFDQAVTYKLENDLTI
ncbi:DUF2975 family protein [Herbinix hemicellulosilytica]|uniref:Putative membrane protein n=1 Tax=Herbinix hemicellulosilytica TaxID=1564487 RepID=A0A0H5SWM3_HERHM|nr:DUF2975 domain-containing protein [Herbinix hemicellulosilytica]RBP59544.1 DUF2975 family protein [Herbinix hemicellulosilytica]CRZ34743.1 putative membrane protein [Herbinix hemicellulosilytica]HPU62778.1 DUF2975 domain-containing protein [Mobilitalea sp.]